MQKLLYTLLLLLAGFSAATAQNMPERRELRRGNSLYDKGEYNAATERYESAAKLAPEQFEAHYNLGNALYKAERYDAAEKSMQRAAADTLRTAEERAEAFYNLGNAQFRQQKYKEALASYRNSLRLNPSDMEAKYNYAYTKRLLEQQQNDQNQQQQNQEQNQEQQQNQQPEEQQGNPDNPEQNNDQPQDNPEEPEEQDGEQPQPAEGSLTEEEAEQILEAIQAQEDKTQEKLKEKHGVVVKGTKNW